MKLIKFTKKMYIFIGDDYKVSEDEVIVEVDHFVQAILFRVALADDVLKDIESRFNIRIEDDDITGYLEMDEAYSKLLRKVR
mgnify:CR=1 FL=1